MLRRMAFLSFINTDFKLCKPLTSLLSGSPACRHLPALSQEFLGKLGREREGTYRTGRSSSEVPWHLSTVQSKFPF